MENFGNNMDGMEGLAGIMATAGIFGLIIAAIILISFWRIFTKAGRPGWEGIIPIYNMYILITQIIGKPVKWFYFVLGGIILSMIPILGVLVSIALLVVLIIIYNDLSKVFGQGVGFTVGLILLSIVFFPILAFGPAEYKGKLEDPNTPPATENV